MCDLSEDDRLRLICLTALLSFLSVIPALGLVVIGSYTRNAVQDKVRLLENFDTSELPIILVAFGLYSVLHNVIGLSVMLSLNRPNSRYTRMGLLCVEIVAGIILVMACVGLAIGCFIQIDKLDQSFHGGLLNAMKLYKKSPLVKMQIDKLQIDYKCCGSARFTDWFEIAWRKSEFINPSDPSYRPRGIDAKREYVNDDVPFSCCKVNVARPCINHHVLNNAKHYKYDFEKDITLNLKGCRHALVEFYGHNMMNYMANIVLGLAVVQV
ncbi:hypothetical protein LOTGIDRAFT_233891 [Lottia gigantea]|uniref:Tetraspanin n=1 Tax=Lottia gigantea TaxID=225164 RepID=V4A090_LOTGI|nr:hypothetical protein LOTGIDRAFT_233891 [Lottia gigantea]ESO90067.1 hypothetical protein LOTGIDRAFT_233891 [Lottia gigantea]